MRLVCKERLVLKVMHYIRLLLGLIFMYVKVINIMAMLNHKSMVDVLKPIGLKNDKGDVALSSNMAKLIISCEGSQWW